ncbi:hypothetical protein Pst134EB_029879 [Puccinia striiformis f. sp. tritici]|nr:hypothetical protein Pst134EB_029879 [Puccinia striiformis f. sp. tritici]
MLATASLKTEGQFDWVYWPVSVSDSELSCIIIKGSIIYQHQTDSANPEDTLLASQQSVNQLKIEKQIFKLIKSCCKREPEPTLQKALDYSTYLKNMNTLEASMKICNFFNLAGLQERISKLKEYRELEQDLFDQSGLVGNLSMLISKITIPSLILKRHQNGKQIIQRTIYSIKSLKNCLKLPIVVFGGGQIFAQAKVFKAPALPRRTDQLAAQQEVEDNKSFDQD